MKFDVIAEFSATILCVHACYCYHVSFTKQAAYYGCGLSHIDSTYSMGG